MLTLKVITTDIDGQQETHLFYGERIQHKEETSNTYNLAFAAPSQVIGSLPDKVSEQSYIYSRVFLYGDSNLPKVLLYILPRAECFITEGGTTVDSFYCSYIAQ